MWSMQFSFMLLVNAILIHATGQSLKMASSSSLKSVGLHHLREYSVLPSGDIAALVYLWNPFTIVAFVGLSTSAIENLMVVLSLCGACTLKSTLDQLDTKTMMKKHLLLGNGIPTSVQEHLPYRLKPSASSSKFRKLIKGFSVFVQEMVSLMSQVSREEKEYSMEELQKEHDYLG
ncbi:Phosphatidylinositol glycan anchor biosynthesis class U protein [Senna tora]|uniref:Phosphatidylinositol glycan anchor biosynthesis class U protein n=1 Tax=Senna tora TaxID=362788 RepID=A0A834XF84_9FABA|nr:Phosphatidylinositol glycan anchor biosynthesis class U protein [Senna tora]